MKHTQIIREITIQEDMEKIWDFMSSPKNLEKITPEEMTFKITSENTDEKMYPGMIISYKVTPLKGIPMEWITEITQVQKNKFFIDEQRIGPYKMWHHQHIFEKTNFGIKMKDIVTYVPPFGIIGKIANGVFIKNQVNKIFDFRTVALKKIFKIYEG
ncbi:MAG: hypothetical protein CMP51_00670 [Flavobacteriales bacterium]|nr:hypothetical protein [Flavobacteriales bacterium]